MSIVTVRRQAVRDDYLGRTMSIVTVRWQAVRDDYDAAARKAVAEERGETARMQAELAALRARAAQQALELKRARRVLVLLPRSRVFRALRAVGRWGWLERRIHRALTLSYGELSGSVGAGLTRSPRHTRASLWRHPLLAAAACTVRQLSVMTANASAPAGGPGRVLRQLADAAFQVARAERQARSQPTACHRAHDAPAAVDTATEPSLNGRDRLLAGRAVANPETWRVGDRARVKVGVGSGVACSELRHHPEEQGHAGRVIGHRTLTGARSHSFLVAFDRPVPVVGMGAIGPVSLPVRYYAADELEPVE